MKLKDLFYLSLLTLLFSFNLADKSSFQSIIRSSFSLEDQQLKITSRLLSAEESGSILKYDLTARGYKPVEITIANTGCHTYTVSRASTSLACATPESIAWKESKRSIPRGVGLKVLSFIFWPFTVASTIDSIHTFKKHRSIVKILKAKGFKDEAEEILPYSLVKRVLYVPDPGYFNTFSLSLEDMTVDELVVVPVTVD